MTIRSPCGCSRMFRRVAANFPPSFALCCAVAAFRRGVHNRRGAVRRDLEPAGHLSDGLVYGRAAGLTTTRLVGLRITACARGLLYFAGHHPKDRHWYLQMLGTQSERQGHGVGSAILTPVLERCDREGERVYLESTKERNIPFYTRHGFQVTEEITCPTAQSCGPCGETRNEAAVHYRSPTPKRPITIDKERLGVGGRGWLRSVVMGRAMWDTLPARLVRGTIDNRVSKVRAPSGGSGCCIAW